MPDRAMTRLLLVLAGCGRVAFDTQPGRGDAPADVAADVARVVVPGTVFGVGFGSPTEIYPAVAWDGGAFAVEWLDSRGRAADPSVAGNLVRPSGAIDNPVPWIIDGFIVGERPAIACDRVGTCALTVGNYDSGSQLYRGMISHGSPIAPMGVIVAQNSSFPAVTRSPSGFLLAYTNGMFSPMAIFAQLLDGTGALVGAPITLEQDASATSLPGCAASATNFICGWLSGARVRYTLISAAGTVMTPGGTPLNLGTTAWAATSSGTGFLVVWREDVGANGQVFAARINTDGTTPDAGPLTVSDLSAAGATPAVTWDGSRYVVVWDTAAGLFEASIDPTTGVVSPAQTLTQMPDRTPGVASDEAGTTLVVFERASETMALILP